jgi:cytochrome c553
MTRLVAGWLILASSTMNLYAQPPAKPNMVDSPSVKVLTGLTVSEFEQEMQHFVEATGISCGGCHMPRGNFASDDNPRKLKAREMIEMTKGLNKQFFASHKPAEGESVLGRVTCYTCHKGEAQPKTAP